MITKLAALHGDFNGDPIKIEGSTFDKVEIRELGIEAHKCIENSYKFAIANTGKIVEGLLLTIVDDKVESCEVHCWNKIKDKYYDTTVEYLQTTTEHKEVIGDKTEKYLYLECVEYIPNESGYDKIGQSTFYYNYDNLIEYVQKSIKRT